MGPSRCRLDGFQGRHAIFDHDLELPTDQCVRHYAGVGREDHFDARFMCFAEIIALDLRDFPVFPEIIFEHAVFGAFRLGVVSVENIH